MPSGWCVVFALLLRATWHTSAYGGRYTATKHAQRWQPAAVGGELQSVSQRLLCTTKVPNLSRLCAATYSQHLMAVDKLISYGG